MAINPLSKESDNHNCKILIKSILRSSKI